MKLNKQVSKLQLPDGEYTFGLNIVTGSDKNTSVENERGNQFCVNFDSELVGPPLYIDENSVVVFLKDNSVYIVNTKTCTKQLHCQLDCFGWNTLDHINYPVTAEYRIVRGCERIIYLQDGVNKDKFINLDRPEKQKTNGEFDCTKFEFNSCVVHSNIKTEVLNTGGNLEYGTYNFAIEWLTANEDSILTTPVDINYTPVVYQNSEGALNIEQSLADIGGKPISNKSIKLSVTDVPEDAVLARIIVFRHITSDGITPSTHVVGNLIQVSGDFEFTYTGFNVDAGDYFVDKNQYLIQKAIYESSLGSVQTNNRLVRYNLKESVQDYSNYQKAASKICSKYVIKEVSKTDNNFYKLNRTFLGGEIILPCIHYVHCNGTISNAFPLIGRSKIANDEILVDDIFTPNSQVEKWKLYDTSIKDGTPIDGYVSSGEFGYYESEQLYQNPPNFCGTDYWGKDCNENNLNGKNIRLFVVPDRSVEIHDDGENIRPIGIWFDESTIEYPNDDIVGHYFSVVIVNQSNISAKGIGAASQYYDLDAGEKTIVSNSLSFGLAPKDIFHFHSGEFNILGNYTNGTHVSIEGNWSSSFESEDEEFQRIFASGLPYDQIHIWNTTHRVTAFNNLSENAVKINKSIILPSSTKTDGIINTNYTLDQNILEVDPVLTGEKLKYISVKNYINPIPNIWSLRTRRITELNENVSFKGDNFISELVIDDIYDFKVEGSETLETILKFIKFGPIAFFIDNEGKDLDAYTEILKGFYIESKVNNSVRHLGTDSCSKHFQHTDLRYDYFLYKMIEPYENNHKMRESFCKFFPGYNKDYSYIQELNKYTNIGLTFDFCSDCSGLYPHRIIFSPQSFSEDLSDQYRINNPNDYIDIPSNTGAIIKIDYKDNKLVVRTEKSCFFIQPNPQQMETNESNVYIGTGDFLSIPAQELNITPIGYGGQQHKLESVNCERGLIWGDKRRGKIYQLGGEFKELNIDMNIWFKDNIKDSDYLIFTYDPYYERFLMTNKYNWTLSYCFKVGGWKSYHSYIPDYYSLSKDTFYSISSKGFWSHDSEYYTVFYNLKFPAIKELIFKNPETFIIQSIQYHGNTYNYSKGYEEDILQSTYDQLLVYNDRQSTGLQTLKLDDPLSFYNDNAITHVKRVERMFKISNFKDLAASSNIWTTDISSVKQGQHGYMDLLPIVNYDKPEVEQGDFKGKWIAARLYTNDHNNKLVLEFSIPNIQKSIR